MQLAERKIKVKKGEARQGIHNIRVVECPSGMSETETCLAIAIILAQRALAKGYVHIGETLH